MSSRQAWFSITLLFKDLDIDPEQITAALATEPQLSHKRGEERYTPAGTKLDGVWRDSAWSYWEDFTEGQHVSIELDKIAQRLLEESEFIQQLAKRAEVATIILSFPGQFHHGIELNPRLLETIADLGLALGFEIFPDANFPDRLPPVRRPMIT